MGIHFCKVAGGSLVLFSKGEESVFLRGGGSIWLQDEVILTPSGCLLVGWIVGSRDPTGSGLVNL